MDDDLPAIHSQPLGNRRADAVGSAGDEGDAALPGLMCAWCCHESGSKIGIAAPARKSLAVGIDQREVPGIAAVAVLPGAKLQKPEGKAAPLPQRTIRKALGAEDGTLNQGRSTTPSTPQTSHL